MVLQIFYDDGDQYIGKKLGSINVDQVEVEDTPGDYIGSRNTNGVEVDDDYIRSDNDINKFIDK